MAQKEKAAVLSPFIVLDKSFIDDSRLTLHDLAVYMALKYFMKQDTRECWPSAESLAEKSRVGRVSVFKSLKHLEELKYITKERRPNGVKGNTSNKYKIRKLTVWGVSSHGERELHVIPVQEVNSLDGPPKGDSSSDELTPFTGRTHPVHHVNENYIQELHKRTTRAESEQEPRTESESDAQNQKPFFEIESQKQKPKPKTKTRRAKYEPDPAVVAAEERIQRKKERLESMTEAEREAEAQRVHAIVESIKKRGVTPDDGEQKSSE